MAANAPSNATPVPAPPPRWRIAPFFIVDDVVATANFYRDKLGFQYERFWGEPPCFCMVGRAGVIIMLSQLHKMGSNQGGAETLTDPTQAFRESCLELLATC